ncbi:PREDICTED: methylosome subunit pICln isoform X2 [Papilio xuthus]|uniref:Methylosome subunit pICln isoform X2 n=1 Tax=Papilio xuthus TaxID=66420 RepID=A0AAJ6ZSJ6_PAPXU|nr:PREDICTED: methylosome subunit pICln isoform X2 [Papilio xuthus]
MVVVSPSFSEPVEGIIMQSPSTKLLVNDQELGTATLYITQHNVVWGGGVGNNGGPSPTISLLYPNISLHAIQREPSAALYMVLNYELRLPELTTQSGDAGDDDDDFDVDDQPITQLRFIPQDEGDLQQMYSAMSQGQSLHPDPTDEVDDDDPYLDGEDFNEGDEEFEDAEESEEAPAERLRQLRLENSNGVHYQDCEDTEIGEE